ncbi:Helix-turn-helix [Variovorax sp. HW608]|uniref:helix-turn-helix domain-containing protein n=1 Tax=Variovorax sp. HW608 TaxID=1034889 RepID=UPI00081F971D|nr:helix-turn-helix transcriptional regulator [Variovorax sp. HW608]SCK09068.1 Helix-turn-helix [Variovorax sp. HW608]
MPAKELTPEQKRDAKRLKVIFRAWQAERQEAGEAATQEELADLLGFGQSATSQYLNGSIPLNPRAAAKFAALIGCDVSEFSASIAESIASMASTAKAKEGSTEAKAKANPVSQRWPFHRVDFYKLSSLAGPAARAMENAMLATASDLDVDIRSKNR